MGTYLNNRIAAFFTLLLVIVSLLYSSTLHAPFNFDDEVVINFESSQKNPDFLKSMVKVCFFYKKNTLVTSGMI